MKRPDHAIISWIWNRPFPNLSKTLMIYFVKIVDRFGQNSLNFTFTKYGLVFMQNIVFSNVCRSLIKFSKWTQFFMENSNKKLFFHQNKQKFSEMVCDINSGKVYIKLNQPYSTADLRGKKCIHSVEDILKWNRLRLTGHLYQQFEPKIKSFLLL